MSILSHAPKKYNLRQVQVDTLLEVEESFDKYDVIVVNLPVASGKSLISQTISKWITNTHKGGKAVTLASNNLLVDQYLKDYPGLATLHASHRYKCSISGLTIKERQLKKMGTCNPLMGCPGCKRYNLDSRKIWAVPYALLNYHMYMARKFYKHFDTVIVDEAHNLIPLLQDLGSSKVWYHKLPKDFRYPLEIHSVAQLKRWVDSIPDEMLEESSALRHFKEAAYSNKYMFKSGFDDYAGEEKHCLKLIPIDLTEEPNLFFPSGVKKIVLMSATISKKDVEQLGLYTRKVKYISADSPIPAEHRPVYLTTPGLNMSFKHQEANIPELVNQLVALADNYPGDKGLVHTPYALASKLRPLLSKYPRFVFHGRDDKFDIYRKFRDSAEPIILVASGMYEGIDLPYDAGRFQAICKVPYPSLADPAIAYKVSKDEDWYTWETLKHMLQAIGRICRGPDDFGETFVLDNSFHSLYRKAVELDFIPEYVRNSIHLLETEPETYTTEDQDGNS